MRTILAAVFTAACLLTGGAEAQTTSPWSGNLGLTSDYVRRGTTRGDEDIELVGGLQYTRGSFYAGTAANTAALGDTDFEVDLFVGYQPELAGWSWDLNAKRVSYFGDSGDINHWEFYVQGTRSFGRVTVVGLIGGSPDYEGFGEEAGWADVNVAYALTSALSADVGGGLLDQAGGVDYAWWQAGITYAFTPSISGDLHWYDTNAAAGLGESGEGQVVAAISWSF